MKINYVNRQSFGARPDSNTKYLLYKLEENDINTKPITDLMNKIYIGDSIKTRIFPNAVIGMDIYDKNGDQKTSIIKGSDNFKVDNETYYIKDAKDFAKKLYDSLFDLALKRDKKQKILDKVNGQLHKGV